MYSTLKQGINGGMPPPLGKYKVILKLHLNSKGNVRQCITLPLQVTSYKPLLLLGIGMFYPSRQACKV